MPASAAFLCCRVLLLALLHRRKQLSGVVLRHNCPDSQPNRLTAGVSNRHLMLT
jgi:hypothetical protein